MTVLRGTRCYLSGPIQYSDPNAPNWRDHVKEVLTGEFGIQVFDPFVDPKQQWAPCINKAIVEKDYDTIQRIAKAFVRKDLALVDRADFIISHLPYKVPTTGTHHEIIVSDNAKKPTLLVCPEGKEHVPAWYYGFIDTNHMFGGWNPLFEYLREVNEGKYTGDYRWAYVYGVI